MERLIRFVKDNFLAERVFGTITDLNHQALEWCERHNNDYHRAVDCIPQQHESLCSRNLNCLPDTNEVRMYLCPVRKISFDGFINYEGRRFGVPYSYPGKTARICRDGDMLYIFSADMSIVLAEHNVTWSRRDSFCEDQYEIMPEEQPTMPVRTQIRQILERTENLSFEKFNFDREEYE